MRIFHFCDAENKIGNNAEMTARHKIYAESDEGKPQSVPYFNLILSVRFDGPF